MRRLCNSVQLAGRLLEKPALSRLSDNTFVVNLKVVLPPEAVGGEKKDTFPVYHLVAWGVLAEDMARKFEKGDRIMVRGRLNTRRTLSNHYHTEIIINEYLLIGRAIKARVYEPC